MDLDFELTHWSPRFLDCETPKTAAAPSAAAEVAAGRFYDSRSWNGVVLSRYYSGLVLD